MIVCAIGVAKCRNGVQPNWCWVLAFPNRWPIGYCCGQIPWMEAIDCPTFLRVVWWIY